MTKDRVLECLPPEAKKKKLYITEPPTYLMRRMWLFFICVCLITSQPELLVIDDFEKTGKWEPISSKGCTVKAFLDRVNAKEGETSLRLEVEFTVSCEQQQCYAGIGREAPDLTGYTFLRLWVRTDTSEDIVLGMHVGLTGGKDGYYIIPARTGWQLVTVSLSDFRGEDEQFISLAPEDIRTISLFLTANNPVTVRINIDEFIALTDSNGNGIPDIDEDSMVEAARNSEQMADQYFQDGNYEKAEKYYQETKLIYEQLGNTKKAQEINQKAKESRAWIDFEEGEDLYQQNRHTEAVDAYEKARKEFVSVGNLEMVTLIESRLEELSVPEPSAPQPEELDRKPAELKRERGGIGGLLFVLLIVVVMGVGVYLWKFRKAPQKKRELEGKPEERPEERTSVLPSETEETPRKLICPFCKNEIEEGWVSCPFCGVKLEDDTRIY